MIKAIIFDCFGVVLTDGLERIVAPLRMTEPEKVAQIVGVVTAASRGIISGDKSREMVADLLGVTTDEYISRMQNGETRNYELLQYVVELRKHYKTAMLSNTSTTGLETRFAPGELDKYFDVSVASGAIGFAKPEAQAYEITADKLDVRLTECVMIDDREEYCDGARGVGMQAILYQSLPQLKTELAKLGVQAPKG